MTLEELLERATPEPNTGCWLWTGATTPDGYGKRGVAGRTWYVHRLAVAAARGEIPPGLEVDHRCRVRLCCNPAHLDVVTHRANTLRGDTVAARNEVKTHCKRGHPLAGANLRGGQRFRACRTCSNALQRRRRAPAV